MEHYRLVTVILNKMAPKFLTLASVFSLLVGVLAIESAHAGPLGQTARAVDNKSSSNDNDSSSRSSTVDHRDDDDDNDNSSSSNSNSSSSSTSSLIGPDYCFSCDDSGTVLNIPTPTGHARLAGQKVRDSDGSFRFDASLVFGRVGAYASADYYFEHIEGKGAAGFMEDDVRVNLFELAPLVRFYDEGPITADLRFGLSVAASSHFDTLPGGVLGLRVLARVNDRLAFTLEGRGMSYKNDVVAYEGVAGAQYSIAWVGYRALKFDVGPVLEGPEAGVRFSY